MSLRAVRQYLTLPSLPARGPMPPVVSVILPLTRTNLITNPSAELNNTNYNSISAVQNTVTGISYHGLNSISYTTSVPTLNDGGFYGTVSLTSGIPYVFSLKFYDPVPNHAYKISFATTGGTDLAAYPFRSTGRWQWLWVFYKETSTTTRRLYFRRDNVDFVGTFYVDGLQLEDLSDGILLPTTYIDGDQQGLLVGQQPPAYGWNGTPHASTSYRSALTRAGGYLVNLSTYNFLLTGLIGLGMAVPNNVSIPYTVLDGARYQRTTKPQRTITLPGRFQADDYYTYQQSMSEMRQAFDRDLVPIPQPLILVVEPQDDCGNVIGDFAQIPCIYAGGLEGNDGNLPVEDVAPTFAMYIPFLVGGDAGVALDVQLSVSNANYILQRSPLGVWSAMGTGATGNPVLALARGLDGKIYAGGSFTGMSGVANTAGIAVWNPTTSSWSAMGTGAAGGNVLALAVAANGDVYAAGTFTSMGGVANTNNIARWNGSAWNAVGTGVSGGSGVNALLAAPNGLVYAGGSFTAMSGVANTLRLASWNGSAWSALSTGANNTVQAFAWGPDGNLYVGGNFTSIGGVAIDRIAKWNGTAFSTLTSAGGAGAEVRDLAFAPNGILYMVGAFTTLGGQSISFAAKWNGAVWTSISSYYTATMQSVVAGPNGDIYFGAGGAFSSPPGWLPDQSLSRYIGNNTILGVDVDMPGTASAYDWLFLPDGTLIVGVGNNGTAVSADITTATNATPAIVYPRLVIKGPSSGTSRIYQIVNYTTGIAVYFNYVINAGETAIFDFDPQHPSFISDFQGDLTSKILPGSNPALLYLAPGANSISFFAAAASVTATLSWQNHYNGVADLVN